MSFLISSKAFNKGITLIGSNESSELETWINEIELDILDDNYTVFYKFFIYKEIFENESSFGMQIFLYGKKPEAQSYQEPMRLEPARLCHVDQLLLLLLALLWVLQKKLWLFLKVAKYLLQTWVIN